ncbi:putative lipoprotein NlpE involved in copper resistance [Dysgonomonas alginatilytica]|uniref:Putative lipoprotein NlpE involved in copper resistance n=1 Tax=Dysgonomonas alginatilytica TaxID=1605892 RepID=A0A2V3PPX2_9BACT|nr:copper resistance protein NlpE [Dysgonomonas alginatilytica]PXV63349.1 putative lipoprotein NlpE involved in copper resistance [Dysgonomonas alginatilytica]
MKKGIVLLFSVVLFSCNNKPQQAGQADSAVLQGSDTVPVVVDEHNAMNSLDYKGVYKGVLPTASGSGMDVMIELADSTYNKKILYVGKGDKAFYTKGSYSWNKEGNTITLEGEEKPNQYFVGENTLTQLDIDGNKIKGEIEEDYILRK